MIQSLVLSFLLGGIIVLTFALVDEKIYQEHQFAFIFLLSTFICVYFAIFVVINFALWISEQAQYKNFGSMLATICFFSFVVSLFHMKIERDQYRKNLELEYKEFSEQQMSRYMAEIQSLYSIVRGFRHDLGNLVISMSLAIKEENIPEIQRIHREVLEKGYKEINTEELSGFNLVNIKDSALRSILIRGWLDARDAGVEMTFETSEPIEQLPVDLLDIVRIVGILVTNALEASKEAEEKKVHVAIFSISKIVYLVIHNTTNEITFDIKKIYEEGYSTKGENRGLGLNNVRKILANYGTMFLETELQENRFLQVLKIGGYEQE